MIIGFRAALMVGSIRYWLLRRGFLFALVAIVLGSLSQAHAEQPIELGVALHLGLGRPGYEKSQAWLEDAGFNSFRDEIFWGDIERVPGQFKIEGRAAKSYENYLAALSRGMRPILILNYGNKLYGGGHPSTDEARRAFSEYALNLLGRFPTDMPYVELWNEWNIGAGTLPTVRDGKVGEYLALAKEVVPKLRNSHPRTQIILGALGDDLGGWPWLTQALNLDLLSYADGISVHLYNHSFRPPNGGAFEMFERLLALQTLLRSRNNGKKFPIYLTETGYPNNISGLTEKAASEQLLGFLLATKLVEDVKGVWLYEWKDSGLDRNEREHNFGALRFDLSEKPLACRLRQLSGLIRRGKVLTSKIDKAGLVMVIEYENSQYLVAVPRLWGETAKNTTVVFVKGQGLRPHQLSEPICADDLTSPGPIKINRESMTMALSGRPVVMRLEGLVSALSVNFSLTY